MLPNIFRIAKSPHFGLPILHVFRDLFAVFLTLSSDPHKCFQNFHRIILWFLFVKQKITFIGVIILLTSAIIVVQENITYSRLTLVENPHRHLYCKIIRVMSIKSFSLDSSILERCTTN